MTRVRITSLPGQTLLDPERPAAWHRRMVLALAPMLRRLADIKTAWLAALARTGSTQSLRALAELEEHEVDNLSEVGRALRRETQRRALRVTSLRNQDRHSTTGELQ